MATDAVGALLGVFSISTVEGAWAVKKNNAVVTVLVGTTVAVTSVPVTMGGVTVTMGGEDLTW